MSDWAHDQGDESATASDVIEEWQVCGVDIPQAVYRMEVQR